VSIDEILGSAWAKRCVERSFGVRLPNDYIELMLWSDGGERSVRGGDFQYNENVLEPTFTVNGSEPPTERYDSLGFRCARAP
jgi:formylglycine-generating enzyme required for sulfatase activity